MSSLQAGYELTRSGTGVLTIGKEIGYEERHIDEYGFEAGAKDLRVMLINPPVSFDVFYGEWDLSDVKSSSPPLGILSLAGMVRKYGYPVKVVDAHADGLDIPAILRLVDEFQPRVVCLTAMTVMISAAAQIAQAIKAHDPGILTFIGGVHVTAEPTKTLARYAPAFDYACVGEGEVVLVDFLERLRQGHPVEETLSLAWKDAEGCYHINERRAFFKGLDEFPPPAFDLVPNLFNHYRLSVFGTTQFKSVGLVTSRGCTGKCTFCLAEGTTVLTSDLRQIPIETVTVGSVLVGLEEEPRHGKYRRFTTTQVTHVFPPRKSEVFRIRTDRGEVIATADHLWLTKSNRWRTTQQLRPGRKVRWFTDGAATPDETQDYRQGYICGAIKSDGYFKRYIKKNGRIHHRCQIVGDHEMMETCIRYANELGVPLKKAKFNGGMYKHVTWKASCYDEPSFWEIESWFENQSPEYLRGFLAGFFDGDGSWTSALRFHGKNLEQMEDVRCKLASAGFKATYHHQSPGRHDLSMSGGTGEFIRFITWCQPKVLRKHKRWNQGCTQRGKATVFEVVPAGIQQVHNFETDCHTFLANGFVSHNCDLGVVGRGYRYHTAEYLIGLMKDVWQRYGVTDFLFYDDLFVGSKPRLKKICETIIREQLPFTWSCCARVDFVHLDMMRQMKQAGCWMIEYGIESGCQRIIDSMRKNITKRKIRETINATHDAGIVTKGNFIFGNPGETHDSLRETIDFACSLKLDYAQHTFLQPLPGSELYETAGRYGAFDPSWDRFNTFSINFIPSGFTRDDLVAYSKYFWRRFYLRPHIWFRELRKIHRKEDVERLWLACKAFVKSTLYKRQLPAFVLRQRQPVSLVH